MKKGRVVGPEQPRVRRYRKDEGATRLEHPGYLLHRTHIIVDVLQHIRRDHNVETAGPER
jgi:hypothetical protein